MEEVRNAHSNRHPQADRQIRAQADSQRKERVIYQGRAIDQGNVNFPVAGPVVPEKPVEVAKPAVTGGSALAVSNNNAPPVPVVPGQEEAEKASLAAFEKGRQERIQSAEENLKRAKATV